jgi:hypothetical protein
VPDAVIRRPVNVAGAFELLNESWRTGILLPPGGTVAEGGLAGPRETKKLAIVSVFPQTGGPLTVGADGEPVAPTSEAAERPARKVRPAGTEEERLATTSQFSAVPEENARPIPVKFTDPLSDAKERGPPSRTSVPASMRPLPFASK